MQGSSLGWAASVSWEIETEREREKGDSHEREMEEEEVVNTLMGGGVCL